jgi:hypothetical protein
MSRRARRRQPAADRDGSSHRRIDRRARRDQQDDRAVGPNARCHASRQTGAAARDDRRATTSRGEAHRATGARHPVRLKPDTTYGIQRPTRSQSGWSRTPRTVNRRPGRRVEQDRARWRPLGEDLRPERNSRSSRANAGHPNRCRTTKPEPRTQNPEPRTQNPEPCTQNPEPRTQNPEPRTQNPEPRTQNPEPRTQNPEHERTLHPEPGTQNPAGGYCCCGSRYATSSPE